MFGTIRRGALGAAVLAMCWSGPALAQPASFTGSYTQNFDSMGAGTVPPPGWQVYQITGGSGTWTNTTGSNSVPAVGAIPNGAALAGGTPSTGLVVNDNPTLNQVQGYNTTGTTGAAGDRAIGTAPTGIAGSAIEVQLTNNSGQPQTGLTVAYDIKRIQVGGDAPTRSPPPGIPEGSEELPGYWLFYSLDGGATYTALDALIPVGAGPSTPPGQPIVPNTVGVTNVGPTQFTFAGGPWAAGSSLILRWIDDNAIDPSPDQIYALDNVSLTPIPEPGSLALCGLAAAALIRFRARRTSGA